MARLFIAIDFPQDVKEHIANACYGVSSARWVPMEQIHLTLRFIGETDNTTYNAVVDALDSVHGESFSLQLSGAGHFPPRGKPRVLWLGIKPQPLLISLQRNIEEALERAGVERERRKFSPHVTVARLRERTRGADIIPFLSVNGLFSAGPISVTEFHLYSSILKPEGAIHRIEQTFSLAPEG
ncbi:MAG: RNA 2',3'-cyclic phosphodiesterase [Chitinivibrionales bacterium]|nr:RNA 2',3'-cyclic phosphodiesterase [Chitinivibrionales bacterium]MBD3358334.1 RNA 2',3'-cyclic phosphodiesterase [Chitinivibrionales bacterium]